MTSEKTINGATPKNITEVYMNMTIINKIALAIAIIGTLNWGLVGLFSFDLVAWLFGGAGTVMARIVYILVAIAGIWCVSMLFRANDEIAESHI